MTAPSCRASRLAAATFLTAIFSACVVQGDQTGDTGDSVGAPAGETGAANIVMVTGTEFAFDAPDTIPAGMTTFRLTTPGTELHHITVLRLTEGKTFADYVAAVQARERATWAIPVGGPTPPPPGGSADATQMLEPGDYALFCFIPSPGDGVPHFAKGMMRPLTVVPASNMATSEPSADVVMTLTDYDFQLSTPLTAGSKTIRVENSADQPHEIVLVRLAPGKTAAEFAEWAHSPSGPPPGTPLGGIAGLAKGRHAYFPADLTPGEYALLCFLPDAKDGKPHIAHGMVKQVSIG